MEVKIYAMVAMATDCYSYSFSSPFLCIEKETLVDIFHPLAQIGLKNIPMLTSGCFLLFH